MENKTVLEEKTALIDTIVGRISLKRRAGISIYAQIRDVLWSMIQDQTLPWGSKLPSENLLAQRLSVSRMTVRQALSELEREGLVERIQGVGTRVRFAWFKHESKGLTGFTEDIYGRGLVPSSRIIEMGTVSASSAVAEALNLPAGTKVDRIHRVRLANDRPVGIHTSFLLPGLINFQMLTSQSSLYALLESQEIIPSTAKETLQAISASLEEATALGIEVGEPLLLVRRITYDINCRPFEVVMARYLADLYEYTVHLQRRVPKGLS